MRTWYRVELLSKIFLKIKIKDARSSRWIFNYGLASLITNTPENDQPKMDKESIAHKMKRISMAIFRGITSGSEPTEKDFFDGKKKEG